MGRIRALQPSVTFKTLLLFIIVLLLFAFGFVLTGCIASTRATSGLFLLELQNNSTYAVRLGYFGLCLTQANTISCVHTVGTNATGILSAIQKETLNGTQFSSSTKDLLNQALAVQKTLITPFITSIFSAATAIFVLAILAILPFATLIYRMKRYREYGASQVTVLRKFPALRLGTLFLFYASSSCTFTTAMSLSQILVLLNLNSKSPNAPLFVRGVASLVIHWIIFALSWLFAVGVTIWVTIENTNKNPSRYGNKGIDYSRNGDDPWFRF